MSPPDLADATLRPVGASRRSQRFTTNHPEDFATRHRLHARPEAQNLLLGARTVADKFSTERASTPEKAFGVHEVWQTSAPIGAAQFRDFYRELEVRTSVYHDMVTIMAQIAGYPLGLRQCSTRGRDRVRETPAARKDLP